MANFGALIALVSFLGFAPAVLAQAKKDASPPKSDPTLLTLERIFSSADFELEKTRALRWRKRDSSYVTLDSAKGGQQLVAHDPATGKSEVLVPDHWLIPNGETRPLAIDGYEFSEDGARMLIYTNSKRVWRANSRGDYWLLDLSSRQLKKLGGDISPSTTQFAILPA